MSSYTAYRIAAQEDRSSIRSPLRLQAKLRPSSEQGFDVTVYDLSVGGFSCDIVTGVRPGSICWLTIPSLAGLQSEIIWNDGLRIGAAFAHLLNPAVLSRLLEQHTVRRPYFG